MKKGIAMNTMKRSDYPIDEEKVSKALQRGEYLLESASLPVIVIGDTAKRMYKHEKLNVDTVEFGIKHDSLSKYALSTLKMMGGENWSEFDHEGVKVKLNVIIDDKGFLERPDQASFWGGWYQIPNPFDEYWKARETVK